MRRDAEPRPADLLALGLLGRGACSSLGLGLLAARHLLLGGLGGSGGCLLGALLRSGVQIQQARKGVAGEACLEAVVLRALLEVGDGSDQLVARAEALLGVLERCVEAEELGVRD